jgi:hypothetical protein
MNDSLIKIVNMYTFVKTDKERTNPEFITQRIFEHNLMLKQRNAISFCKKALDIKTTNLASLTNEDKEGFEQCLYENFLKENPDYFGKRNIIFLDLHEYENI